MSNHFNRYGTLRILIIVTLTSKWDLYALSKALNKVWDVLSRVAEMAWDVLSGAAKMAWDVLSGVTKAAWDVLSGVAN